MRWWLAATLGLCALFASGPPAACLPAGDRGPVLPSKHAIANWRE